MSIPALLPPAFDFDLDFFPFFFAMFNARAFLDADDLRLAGRACRSEAI